MVCCGAVVAKSFCSLCICVVSDVFGLLLLLTGHDLLICILLPGAAFVLFSLLPVGRGGFCDFAFDVFR